MDNPPSEDYRNPPSEAADLAAAYIYRAKLIFNEIDAINFMLAVAAGKLTEPQVAEWIRQRLISP